MVVGGILWISTSCSKLPVMRKEQGPATSTIQQPFLTTLLEHGLQTVGLQIAPSKSHLYTPETGPRAQNHSKQPKRPLGGSWSPGLWTVSRPWALASRRAGGRPWRPWPRCSEDIAGRCFDCRNPKDHLNIRISHSGSKAQYKVDTTNKGLWDLCVYVVFLAPTASGRSSHSCVFLMMAPALWNWTASS